LQAARRAFTPSVEADNGFSISKCTPALAKGIAADIWNVAGFAITAISGSKARASSIV